MTLMPQQVGGWTGGGGGGGGGGEGKAGEPGCAGGVEKNSSSFPKTDLRKKPRKLRAKKRAMMPREQSGRPWERGEGRKPKKKTKKAMPRAIRPIERPKGQKKN